MGSKIRCLIVAVIGGLITYLSMYSNVFGEASGLIAVVGVIILFIGVVFLVAQLPGGLEAIDKGLSETKRRMDAEQETKRFNRDWNNAQRDYDRYNHRH